MPGLGAHTEGFGLGNQTHSMWKPNAPRDFFTDKGSGVDPLKTQR